MASISINIPDAIAPRVLGAFAGMHNYDAASGLTKAQFAKAIVAGYVKNTVRAWEANQAIETARLASIANSEVIQID